jgi:hypothetical protein
LQEIKQTFPHDRLPVPLYHGTSTLFLSSIVEFGLGGRNPIKEWRVLEFAKAIYPLVAKHLAIEDDWMVKAQSFKWMVEQRSAAMNFQHCETYLSASPLTAVRYALNKRCGSELLSYTLDFLAELARLKVDGVCDQLYRIYPHIFEQLDTSPAPLLIQIDGIAPAAIMAENGRDPEPILNQIHEVMQKSPDLRILLQQANFRLKGSVPSDELKVWLISPIRWDPICPDYSLYPLSLRDDAPLIV